tara:strand:- start:2031 stop:3371 length:1341 start_codon:yes stop_codon:yes gene_type:complete
MFKKKYDPSSMYSSFINSNKLFNVMTDGAYNNPVFDSMDYKKAIQDHKKHSMDLINKFINNVNEESKKSKTIVFIAGKCYPMMARQAFFLRKKGYKTFLISMQMLNSNDIELLFDSFDEIVHKCLFYPVLGKILKSINPKFYHVQCWMWNYTLGKFIIENKGESKVISEFYDVTGMYSEPENLKSVFWDRIVDLDLYCEKFIFDNSDGIIHRYKKEIFLNYSKKYNRTKNILQFQQYPISFDQKISKSKRRLVYCGTIIGPNDKRHPRKLFPTSGMCDAFDILLSQDFEINLYLPISSNELNEYDKWILNLKNKYPKNLYIHKSLPIQRLIKEISQYDFGINLSNMDKPNSHMSKYSFDGGMGTKTYTFLEAGLPVIVNKEYNYMSEVIEKNKIGLSLNSYEIKDAKKILKKFKIFELKSNVKQFFEKNNIWTKGKELESFYSSLI